MHERKAVASAALLQKAVWSDIWVYMLFAGLGPVMSPWLTAGKLTKHSRGLGATTVHPKHPWMNMTFKSICRELKKHSFWVSGAMSKGPSMFVYSRLKCPTFDRNESTFRSVQPSEILPLISDHISGALYDKSGHLLFWPTVICFPICGPLLSVDPSPVCWLAAHSQLTPSMHKTSCFATWS